MTTNFIEGEGHIVSSPLTETNVNSGLDDYITLRYGPDAIEHIRDFIREDVELNIENGCPWGISYPVRELYKGVLTQDPERVNRALDFLVATTRLSQEVPINY